MAPKPKGSTAHCPSSSPSYPMGTYSTGGSSYTNTVPEENDADAHTTTQQQTRNADHNQNLYPPPPADLPPPQYAPPNRAPPGHTPLLPHNYNSSQQHLVQDQDNAPAHPPPAYTKYTTAAQARWARSSRIAKFLCIGFMLMIVLIIVGVSAGVSLSRGSGGGPGPGSGSFGPGGSDGPPANCASDVGNSCSANSDCMSGFCRPDGICGC